MNAQLEVTQAIPQPLHESVLKNMLPEHMCTVWQSECRKQIGRL